MFVSEAPEGVAWAPRDREEGESEEFNHCSGEQSHSRDTKEGF